MTENNFPYASKLRTDVGHTLAKFRAFRADQHQKTNQRIAQLNSENEKYQNEASSSLLNFRAALKSELTRSVQQEKASYQDALEQQVSDNAKLFAKTAGELRILATQAAPDALGIDPEEFTEDITQNFERTEGPGSLIRIGNAQHSGGSAPAIVPFLGTSNISIYGDSVEARRDMAEEILTRILASVNPHALQVTVFDPDMKGILGQFGALKNHAKVPKNILTSPGSNRAFEERLEEIRHEAARLVDLRRGKNAHSFLDLWEESRTKPTVHVVVVDNTPEVLDDRTIKFISQIAKPENGVHFVVLESGGTAIDFGPGNVILDRSNQRGTVTWRSKDGTYTVSTDSSFTLGTASSIVEAIAKFANADAGPEPISADNLRPADGTLWAANSAQGLEAVIGQKEDGSPLTVDFRSANPARPFALVGGQTGSGKSILLLSLIYSLAAKYSPDELEMYLVDFKEGLEFQRFIGNDGKNWLPHAKVVALEGNPVFGLSVLEDLYQQFQNRSRVFKRVGASSYDEYRAKGHHDFPRLLVVMDEFQVMFAGSSTVAEEATNLLSRIVREARAYGIHIVLSTQTLSGIDGLQRKADSIFSQVPIRISMKNTVNESKTILGDRNTEPTLLKHRGAVIVNQETGEDPANNVRGTVTFAEKEAVKRLQTELWELGKDQYSMQRPYIFRGTDPADWPVQVIDSYQGRREVLVGASLDVKSTPITHSFESNTSQSLMVVGNKNTTTQNILAGAIRSATEMGYYQNLYCIGDSWLSDIAHQYGFTGDIQTIAHLDAAQWLATESDALPDRSLIIVEDAQRINQLDRAFSKNEGNLDINSSETLDADSGLDALDALAHSFDGAANALDDSSSIQATGKQRLIELVENGSSEGKDLIIHIQSTHAITNILGYSSEAVGGTVAVNLRTNDLSALFHERVEASEGDPRLQYSRPGVTDQVVTAIPYGSINLEES
ncbi:hypothetical protein GCM10009794_21610 [Rothia terrae]